MPISNLRRFSAALLMAGTAFVFAADPAVAQQQQQPAPERIQVVPLDQATIDRWLILYAEVGQRLAKEQEVTEEKRAAAYDQACPKAGLTDVGECYALDDYVTALLEGVSEDGTSFSDPIARARAESQQINADKSIPAEEKKQIREEIQGRMATMPRNIPPAHLQLLSRNASRIAEVQQRFAPQEQQPQGNPQPRR